MEQYFKGYKQIHTSNFLIFKRQVGTTGGEIGTTFGKIGTKLKGCKNTVQNDYPKPTTYFKTLFESK